MLGAAQFAICCLFALPRMAWAVLPIPIATCATLSAPGGVYQVTSDITASGGGDCIAITAPLVTLELGGHTITGTGSGIGIHVTARDAAISNSLATQATVTGFQTGIQFDPFATRGYVGATVFIINNSMTGIEIKGANEVSLISVLASGSSFGLHASNSNGDSATSSSFGSTSPIAATGAELDQSNASFSTSDMAGSDVGLHLVSSNYNTIFVGSTGHISGTGGIGVWLERSSDNVFPSYGAVSGTGGSGLNLTQNASRNLFANGLIEGETLVDRGSGQNRILDSGTAGPAPATDLNPACDQNVWFDNNFTSVNQSCIR